jgi:tetratricopeptide (TPR) repeat protein
MKRGSLLVPVLLLSALVGCASNVAPGAAAPEGPGLKPSRGGMSVREFERQQRERAEWLEQRGRLGEAAWVWEVLTVLRPREYEARLADVRKRIDAAVDERMPKARAELKRGDLDAAERSYLAVLALQPPDPAEQTEAADALRQIDRTRNKRDFLGQPSRVTLLRKGAVWPPPDSDPVELEHASMLASQGELEDAIAILERRLKESPRDTPARSLLADLLVNQATAQHERGENGAARATLAKALKVEPANGAGLNLQRKLATAKR